MLFLTWNILHGAGPTRLPEVLLSLLRHNADVVALTEFRAARGSQIRSVLADHGLSHQLTSHPPRTAANGILIASRFPLEASAHHGPPNSRGRWLDVFLPSHALRLLAVHVPDDTRPTDKAAYWQTILSLARRQSGEKCLILGDFNTGRRFQDGPAPNPFDRASIHGCEALLGSLLSLGYADAWRRLNPEAREFSWFSPDGSGRRIDAAYLSPPLVPLLQTAVYSHLERESRLSDHSPLLLDLALPPAHSNAPALAENAAVHARPLPSNAPPTGTIPLKS